MHSCVISCRIDLWRNASRSASLVELVVFGWALDSVVDRVVDGNCVVAVLYSIANMANKMQVIYG